MNPAGAVNPAGAEGAPAATAAGGGGAATRGGMPIELGAQLVDDGDGLIQRSLRFGA